MSAKTLALDERLDHLDLLPALVVDEAVPFGEVLNRMRQSERGSVVVCRDGRVTGIFTERDYLNRCSVESIRPETPISDMMTPHPYTVKVETTLGQAIELMHSKGVRNLPLIDAEGRPQGLLTVGRIIRYLAEHFPAEVVNLPPKLHAVSNEPEGA